MRVANWHIHSWPNTSKEFVNPQWRQHSRYKLSINCCLLSIQLPRYCTEFVLNLEGLVFVYWGNISTQWGLIFYIIHHLHYIQTTKAYQPFRNSANRLGSPPSYAEGGARGSTLRRVQELEWTLIGKKNWFWGCLICLKSYAKSYKFSVCYMTN